MNPLDWIIHPRQTTANVRRRLRRYRIHVRVWLGWVILLVLVAVAVIATVVFWGWISNDLWTWLGTTPGGQDRQESNSTTLRNIGLVIAGVIALPLAVWRSIVAQRQAKTAQQDLLNDRYQKGAEMLGNDVLSVRLGGIYALQRLAEEHPEEYHIQILRLLCAFARNPARNVGTMPKHGNIDPDSVNKGEQRDTELQMPDDVKAVIEAIRDRKRFNIALERRSEFKITSRHAPLLDMYTPQEDFQDAQLQVANLSGANLRGAFLFGADLRGIELSGVNLEGAILVGANLCGVRMSDAKLSGAMLDSAKLSAASLSGADLQGASLDFAGLASASLDGANLTKTNLTRVQYLTQAQLDKAGADPSNPPILEEAVDSRTGKPLIWRGGALDEEA